MKLPVEFLASLEGVSGFEKEPFVAVHEREEGVTSIRINPKKPVTHTPEVLEHHSPVDHHKLSNAPVPWSQFGFYLTERPSFTFDPLFHAGCYYVQEASSMFLEQALKQLLDLTQPLKVLDLCAAPGGKSTHIHSLLNEKSLLVSNEVIKARSIVLTDNIIKWGCSNVIVTNNDPKAFQKVPGYFDVMVVDAPCSGSGLFRKDPDAIKEWSLNNVNLCSQRQQRILADALPALKEGGLLIYSTCSYSLEEDEEIMDWLAEEMDMENVALQTEGEWNIVSTKSTQTSSIGYRFYPDKTKGEGFFLTCFLKRHNDTASRVKMVKPDILSSREKVILDKWIKKEPFEFLRFRNTIYALPLNLLQEFSILQALLNIQYLGVAVGEILKDRLVPHHALAQSIILSGNVTATDLSYDDAIRYLQRNDLSIQPEDIGWQVVRYVKQPLGWINALKNRLNNYYPKEIRILKQNNTPFEK